MSASEFLKQRRKTIDQAKAELDSLTIDVCEKAQNSQFDIYKRIFTKQSATITEIREAGCNTFMMLSFVGGGNSQSIYIANKAQMLKITEPYIMFIYLQKEVVERKPPGYKILTTKKTNTKDIDQVADRYNVSRNVADEYIKTGYANPDAIRLELTGTDTKKGKPKC